MDNKEYVAAAVRTESVPEDLQINEVVLHAMLNIAKGAALLLNQAKRRMYYGKQIDLAAVGENLNLVGGAASFLAQAMSNNLDFNERINAEDREAMLNGAPAHIQAMNLDNLDVRLTHAGMGLFTESGEILEALLKQYEGEGLDMTNFGEELGDNQWYVAIAHDRLGVGMDQTHTVNIAKLRKRFPEKFSKDEAINRDVTAERQILEGGGE